MRICRWEGSRPGGSSGPEPPQTEGSTLPKQNSWGAELRRFGKPACDPQQKSNSLMQDLPPELPVAHPGSLLRTSAAATLKRRQELQAALRPVPVQDGARRAEGVKKGVPAAAALASYDEWTTAQKPLSFWRQCVPAFGAASFLVLSRMASSLMCQCSGHCSTWQQAASCCARCLNDGQDS